MPPEEHLTYQYGTAVGLAISLREIRELAGVLRFADECQTYHAESRT